MTRKYALESQLPFWRFAEHFPMYMIIIYILSSYFWYFINYKRIFPLTIEQVLQYISPVWYEFHLVWIILWFALCGVHFLSAQQDKNIHLKRIDSWFLALGVALVPLGIFLLLWDNFIGIESTAWYSISALTIESELSTFGSVLPIGMLLSLLGVGMYLGTKFWRLHQPQVRWYGLRWLAIFLLILCGILLLQMYPRHAVMSIFGITRDIKNYVVVVTAWWLLWLAMDVYSHFSYIKE